MRTLPLVRCVALLAIAGALSCSRSTTCDQAPASCKGPAPVAAREGEDFTLTPGTSARIASARLTVAFERVASDSRCPRDVVCVWAGNAAVQLRVETDSAPPWSGTINTGMEPRIAQLGNYQLNIVALLPDPVSTSSIEPLGYRIILRLTPRQP